jgi:hypothetical protein
MRMAMLVVCLLVMVVLISSCGLWHQDGAFNGITGSGLTSFETRDDICR